MSTVSTPTSETSPSSLAKAAESPPARQRLTVTDESPFANLLDTSRFEHLYRVASLFAASKLVPAHFQGAPENCFIAVQMAVRLGVDPFMFMQNTYIVHGRPGMEAKLAIALVNSSGLFVDSLDYEITGGSDPFADGYKARAFAVRKTSGKRVEGPWIDWALVRAEKWDGKDGSKWRTMPAQMFQYRAATFFARLHCPERLLGMYTADELDDAPMVRQVENLANPEGRDPMAEARVAASVAAASMAAPKPEPDAAKKPDDSVAAANEEILRKRKLDAAKPAPVPSDDSDLLGQPTTPKAREGGRKL